MWRKLKLTSLKILMKKFGGIFCYHMQRYKKYNTGNQIVGKSGCFGLNLSDNSVMRGRVHAKRTLKGLVADLRIYTFHLKPRALFKLNIKKSTAIIC